MRATHPDAWVTLIEHFPLSIQQRWLWSLLRRHPHWNCTLACGYRLRGSLDVARLRHSIQEITDFHKVLRTWFPEGDQKPVQRVAAQNPDNLESGVVEGRTRPEIDANAAREFDRFSLRQFDPSTAPPLRFRLLRLSADEHWLLLAIHRLLVDCSSATQILTALWDSYEFPPRTAPIGSTLQPQYVDYAAAQHHAGSVMLEKRTAYWRNHLTGAKCIEWPLETTAAAAARGGLLRTSSHFGSELSIKLKALARRLHSLPGTVVLAAFAAVVWLWCRQDDFVVSFNVAGRQTEQSSMIGVFAHILYLRLQMDGTKSFTELLSRVTAEFFHALTHQDFGAAATRQPELMGGAFVQWVNWHPEMVPRELGPQLQAERLAHRDFTDELTAIPPAIVDVEVTFFDTPDGIQAFGAYRADLFSVATMSCFMADVRMVAEQIVRDPRVKIEFIQLSK